MGGRGFDAVLARAARVGCAAAEEGARLRAELDDPPPGGGGIVEERAHGAGGVVPLQELGRRVVGE
eukprot:2593836-Prymnesium_polylepis.1